MKRPSRTAQLFRMARYSALCLLLSLSFMLSSSAHAAFWGSNGKILYEKGGSSGFLGFHTIEANGSNPTQLNNPNMVVSSAAWSANGDYIFYSKQGPDGNAIYMMNADGTGEQRVSEYGVGGQIAASPDGSRLAIADTYSNTLALIDIEHGHYGVIADGYYTSPVWAPDASALLYAGPLEATGKNHIYKYDLASGEITQLTDHAGWSWPVDWSSDGSAIAYISSLHPSGNDGSEWRLYLMDPSGTTRIGFDDTIISRPVQHIYDAAFSPDNNRLVYSLWEDITDKTSIRVVDGGNVSDPTTVLETDAAWQSQVAWQPINSWISSVPQPTPTTTDIHRFYSPLIQHHFFTANAAESNYIQSHFPPSIWTYENIGFGVRAVSGCGAGESVYRFYSETLKTHLYTMDENEKSHIMANFPPSVWRYEGVAYCADYLSSRDTKPVYRFYSELLKTHLFTINELEAIHIMDNYPEDIWRYEGVAYYAYPRY